MRGNTKEWLEEQLRDIPTGSVAVEGPAGDGRGQLLLDHQFSARTQGKGRIQLYSVFPGVEASYSGFVAPEVTVHHRACPQVLEVFYCHSGRVGWNMQGGTAVYLGPGDVAIHSAACCAQSAMMFPLGYARGLSLSMDLSALADHCPEILRTGQVSLEQLQSRYCAGEPVVLAACPALEQIFAPVYAAPPLRCLAYLQLKVQELLLYLADARPQTPAPYAAQQTERIKEIHRQLTGHLDRRYTIQELSRQYLMNTSTLKEVFKAVYGLPIATYMKEYRIRQAMKLLRDTDDTVAQIAQQVGYHTQGKFTQAFKDVAGVLPTEYRSGRRPSGSNPT